MIPKHGFACLLLLMTLSFNAPVYAAVVSGNDTAIGAMESKLFSHPYSLEADDKRLNRLEKFVFGEASASSPASERLNRLTACVALRNNHAKSINSPAFAPAMADLAPLNLLNVSSYPLITQLEMRMLGKSYLGETVTDRLCRLEIKEFGRASRSNDLAARVDTLNAITTSNAEKTRVNELANFQSPTTVVENYRRHVSQIFRTGATAQTKEQPNTVVDQIEYLESAAFGKKCFSKSLQKRVDALEEKYYGAMKVDDKNLTYRVAQLLTLVNRGS
ncbi:MAG: hypothetical protein KGS72_28290 [Cyanobacteria bacterium REEB67]|nr:hypothetical protein [Cyanobacteria bacterium REEB67]